VGVSSRATGLRLPVLIGRKDVKKHMRSNGVVALSEVIEVIEVIKVELATKPSMPHIRRQATLFLRDNATIDQLRWKFNPIQAALIAPHITLCREDEVDDWGRLEQVLREHRQQSVTLHFGNPLRDGNLVYLPSSGAQTEFENLRALLLDTATSKARPHQAHVTIIHPRNGVCTSATFADIAASLRPFTATFEHVSLIEQIDGGPWRELGCYSL
jgi:2'-5' RNA ligase